MTADIHQLNVLLCFRSQLARQFLDLLRAKHAINLVLAEEPYFVNDITDGGGREQLGHDVTRPHAAPRDDARKL